MARKTFSIQKCVMFIILFMYDHESSNLQANPPFQADDDDVEFFFSFCGN